MHVRDVVAAVLLATLAGCASPSSSRPPAASGTPPSKASAPSATAAPRGRPTWLPVARNGELDTIDGVPLISVDGADLLVDGLRIGDVNGPLKEGRPTRLAPLFEALRSRREAWLTVHAGEAWPGVVAYRFHPEVSAAVVKSVVLTAGYAACPNGSFLVEMRSGEGRHRVGRLPVDPLMMAEPDEKILTVDVKPDAFVVTWKDTKSTGRTKVIPRPPTTDGDAIDLSALEAQVDALWGAAGLHRAATDKRFDQAILHVDNGAPYKLLVAVVDALYGPRRSMQVGRHEERVPALNVNLAGD